MFYFFAFVYNAEAVTRENVKGFSKLLLNALYF